MPEVRLEQNQVVIYDAQETITGRHLNQLAYWGFVFEPHTSRLVAAPADIHGTLDKVLKYLLRHGIAHTVTAQVAADQLKIKGLRAQLEGALESGRRFKTEGKPTSDSSDFLSFLRNQIPRRLKDHQLKAALHLLAVENGANFSVPGSGKTTVVLSVYAWLRARGIVSALFVVGPTSCFGPWKAEFKAVLGRDARHTTLAGGDVRDRHDAYIAARHDHCELYLTTFQTLQRDWSRVRDLFAEAPERFFLIIDEAHYMKQVGGAWASAALNVAQLATRRCVLTGTPFPRTYSDAFNLFDVLWPRTTPLSREDRLRIEVLAQKHDDDGAAAMLTATIGPLFYRVRKDDLGLAEQHFHPPIMVEMGQHEKYVYDAILDRIRTASMDDYLRDIDLLTRLRRGRMTRLRQAVSYAKLLASAVDDYGENLIGHTRALADVIRQYDELEVPGKIRALKGLVRRLRSKGEKVLVWSNFIGTLKLIRDQLASEGNGVRLLFGETPTEATPLGDELSREEIIAAFVEPGSGIDILVANPAACAESISLHKTCSHAVYYDLSYNCAQYLQSLDRIHRVGGSETRTANYYFLQYAATLDQDVLDNVQAKARRMSAIVDQEYPVYGMDMFASDDELEAYARLFR